MSYPIFITDSLSRSQQPASLDISDMQDLPVRHSQSKQRNSRIHSTTANEPSTMNDNSHESARGYSEEITVLASEEPIIPIRPSEGDKAPSDIERSAVLKTMAAICDNDGDYDMGHVDSADFDSSQTSFRTFEKFFNLPTCLQTKILALADVCYRKTLQTVLQAGHAEGLHHQSRGAATLH
jgi:hypothetical protein